MSLKKRDLIFEHRGHFRFKVLKIELDELCGATNKDRPLDVDHIILLSKNGPQKNLIYAVNEQVKRE